MQSFAHAVLRSWSIPPVATFGLALTALTYLRGCWVLRRAGYPYLSAWRLGSFGLGLFALWLALASPLDTFSGFVLTAHMLQHMMLMMVAPPLLLLGEPLIPIVRGIPRFAAREFAGPFLNWRVAERIGLSLTNPVIALALMGIVMFAWHVPGPYEMALRSSSWHQVEHACFFLTSIIFWWPVIQPWPSHAQWPRWAMVPYLVIADLQNTVLSAVLVFSDKILYPSYAVGLNLFGFTAQEDQAAAGATMWVVGSLAFVVPAVLIAIQCLSRIRSAPTPPMLRRNESPVVDRVVTGASPASWPIKILGSRLSSRSIEVVSFLVWFGLTAAGFVGLSHLWSDDDNQVLRLSQQTGPFDVAVYGPAGEIPLGQASFAALVQDRASRDVLLDSDVEFTMRKANDKGSSPQRVHALPGDENKVLLTADVDLDSEGPWMLDVAVKRAAEIATVSLPLEVVKPETGSTIPWSYIVTLVIAVVLCLAYVWRYSGRNSARLAAEVAQTNPLSRTW